MRHVWQWVGYAVLGALVSNVFYYVVHRLWWDAHPGSESYFLGHLPWYGIGSMALMAVVSMAAFYVREYWDLFFNSSISSQEEQHGIQR